MLLSLVVPGGAFALIVASETDSVPSSYDEDALVDIHNDLIALAETAPPGAEGAAKAREVGSRAEAWGEKWEAKPEWEKVAVTTAAMAEILARDLEKPGSVSDKQWNAALMQLDAAVARLPLDRQPEE